VAPRGVPWPSRGVPWPLYEDHMLKPAIMIYWRHLCSAGRPSRWALAHILVVSLSQAYSILKLLWKFVHIFSNPADRSTENCTERWKQEQHGII